MATRGSRRAAHALLSALMIAILGAFWPEIEPLLAIAPKGVTCRAVGVGLVEAALGTARFIERERPEFVIFVGTAGAFTRAGVAIGEVYAVNRVVLAEPPAAQFPEPMPRELSLRVQLSGLPLASVATTLGITSSDGAAEELALRLGCDLEHLELFAVASACATANVPCACVLGVTNLVGSDGRAQWASNHRHVSARVADAVRLALPSIRDYVVK